MRRNKPDRKQLLDGALSLLVLAGTISLAWLGLTSKKYVPAEAAPAMKYSDIPADAVVIVIDAGHGGFDGGATGTESGVSEDGINLKVAELLSDELTKSGYYVIMTRSDGNALGETKNDDMRARKNIMQLECVDLVVSIHMNKFGDRSVSGPMVFYMKGSEEGRTLAGSVIKSLCEAVDRPPRSANPEDLFVLRVPSAPSIIVECGFLSNKRDEELLLTDEYRQKLANGIADGINDYFALKQSGDNE